MGSQRVGHNWETDLIWSDRRNINNLRYADDTILMTEWRRTKKPLDESKRVDIYYMISSMSWSDKPASVHFSSVQSLSHVRLFATPWISACQASLSITNSCRVHSDSRPSSQWCHPAISSSVVPFSSCPQPLPASDSFPMSQLFSWGGQSTGVSTLASFLPKK